MADKSESNEMMFHTSRAPRPPSVKVGAHENVLLKKRKPEEKKMRALLSPPKLKVNQAG